MTDTTILFLYRMFGSCYHSILVENNDGDAVQDFFIIQSSPEKTRRIWHIF